MAMVQIRYYEQSDRDCSDDTESIYSVQEKETDVVQDSSDCNIDSDSSGEYVEYEYEVASMSSGDEYFQGDSSSGTDGIQMTASAIAAVFAVADSSLSWATDGEDSDSINDMDSSRTTRTDFWACIQCKSENNNPQFQYCEKCFQCWLCKARKNFKCFPLCNACFKVRKNLFPPRPRRAKKRKLNRNSPTGSGSQSSQSSTNSGHTEEPPLKRSHTSLTALAHDSGLGSSQEITSIDFNSVTIPSTSSGCRKRKLNDNTVTVNSCDNVVINSCNNNLTNSCGNKLTNSCGNNQTNSCSNNQTNSCDNNLANSCDKTLTNSCDKTLTNSCDKTLTNSCDKTKTVENSCDNKLTTSCDSIVENSCNTLTASDSKLSSQLPENFNTEYRELCIICNIKPKDAIFLHGKIAHMCCCYKCSMQTWRISKRCPMCQCKVKNVVKVFTT